ncbi:MAG: ABC transporter substrate-binding protein [Campylobacteraceae bacterium]|nr:ABC transporter substrate-binding protein [Campylobacteraceae bacterium]
MKKTLIFQIFILLTILNSNLLALKQEYISISNEAKYKKGFKHFAYVNTNAKKGGQFKIAAKGTYNSFNAFAVKGIPAAGINMIYDTLMKASENESFTFYPLLAQYIEVSAKNDWVKFYINKKARFNDGKEVTAEDVKFSFELLITKASPFYKRYYSDVKNVEVIDKLTVKFNFKNNKNKELSLLLGQLTILPKHFWKDKNFLKADAIVPLGSGPYIIHKYKFSKYITLKRDNNYWAKDLAVNIGSYNYDYITYDYYKDSTVTLEAFKAGEFDYRVENSAKNWATLYTGKNFDNNKIIKEKIKHQKVQGMQALIFNTRKELFQDIQLRKALNLAFDFEWTNKKLFFSQYKRLDSYFANSELSSKGLPSKDELKILNKYKKDLPSSVFTEVFKNNKTKGDGNIRTELKQALKILKKQGWKFENKVLVKNGKKLEFQILLASSALERVLHPFVKNLKKIGVIANINIIDSVAYRNKLNNFEYDMIIQNFRVSLSPGNELKNLWGKKAAGIKASSNYIGIKSDVIDSLINNIVIAKDRKDLITSVKVLDRVLLNNYYVIPNWYLSSYRIAYWNKFNKPKISPKYGLGIFTWWIKDEFIKKDKG